MTSRVLLVASWLLPGCLLCGCGSEPPAEPVRPVRAIKVGDVSGLSGRSLPGQASAAVEVNLSFRVAGPLEAFPVNVGDVVDQGDLLAKIDPTDFEVDLRAAEGNLARAEATLESMRVARPEELEQLRAAVQKAQAAADRAKSDFARAEKLIKTQTIAQEEYDRARQEVDRTDAELRQAQEALRIGEKGAREEDIRAKEAEIKSLEAAVENARNRLAYTDLKAPFRGTVVATYVENYEFVQAKQAILRLLDTTHIEMKIDVPESGIAMIPFVKDLVVTFREIPDREFPAEVKEVGIEASPTTRTYPVTLVMENPDGVIFPGMVGDARGKVELPDEVEEQGYEVPESAVFTGNDDRQYVWVIDAGTTAKKQPVTVSDPTPRGIRVKGLDAGQIIATAGVHYLHEGQKVSLLDEPAKEVSP